MLDHFLDNVVTKRVIHESLGDDLLHVVKITCLNVNMLGMSKDSKIKVYDLIVDLLFADSCALRAIPVIDVN